jgi:hypothetical protein
MFNKFKLQPIATALTQKEVDRASERCLASLSLVGFDQVYIFAISDKYGKEPIYHERVSNLTLGGFMALKASIEKILSNDVLAKLKTDIEWKPEATEEDKKGITIKIGDEKNDVRN